MPSSKKLNSIITELFIRGRKLNSSLVSNSTHYFIMKNPNKSELQQIAINYFPNIDLKRLKKIHKNILRDHIVS